MTTATVTSRLLDYGNLMKPRITLLALVTTFVGFQLASVPTSSLQLLFFTLVGTALGSSSASTLNNYVDRNLDKKMSRTCDRSLPAGRILPTEALVLGLVLGVSGIGILAWLVNPLTAALLLFTIAFYIYVYTLWLKRTSPYSTEIGGVAGSMPPVIGWTAATGTLSVEALALFLIMFIWQPPHFWALGIYYMDDYKNAGIPRFPVVKGVDQTRRRTLFYNTLLIPASFSLYLLGMAGITYLIAAAILGLAYLMVTIQFTRNEPNPSDAIKLFSFSNLYLLLLFVVIFVSSDPIF